MNDSDLEAQLRALSPAAPSAGLASRIERELAAAPRAVATAGVIARPTRAALVLRGLRDLGWAGAGAGAMLAAMALFSPVKKAAPPVVEEQAYEPAESSRELVAVDDSNELIETEDGPVRQVRYTYRERMAWAHPGTGARLEIEVPREDVVLLPVSLQ
jgi:hypothetical protein